MISAFATTWHQFHQACILLFGIKCDSVESVINFTFENNISCEWIPLHDWESLADIHILENLPSGSDFSGDLYILAESSYKHFPYKVASDDMVCFASQHLSYSGECLFNGDLLIFNPVTKEVWLFHHEGLYSNFRLR
ncbi:hypothetical protein [Vibrio quintilis]|uniref:Uncharacterized protein n=1 Tax=Vibrio quintilis TaxID=1117707 RepID=A0A1M7YR07_9VIBR|nr:hypothetical protein [Vibrio quintilis]SHO55005.1 hypothetical protein VQ7734_00724 [Vibrio quintilis]